MKTLKNRLFTSENGIRIKKDEISRIRILDVYRNMHGHVRRSPGRNRSDG